MTHEDATARGHEDEQAACRAGRYRDGARGSAEKTALRGGAETSEPGRTSAVLRKVTPGRTLRAIDRRMIAFATARGSTT